MMYSAYLEDVFVLFLASSRWLTSSPEEVKAGRVEGLGPTWSISSVLKNSTNSVSRHSRSSKPSKSALKGDVGAPLVAWRGCGRTHRSPKPLGR